MRQRREVGWTRRKGKDKEIIRDRQEQGDRNGEMELCLEDTEKWELWKEYRRETHGQGNREGQTE